MGSLNWASGLIPLGRLQRHLQSLGPTNRFTPPCRSVPLVLATLLRQWQDLHVSFLMSGGCDIQTVGNSSSGHVCRNPQHASSAVYVFSSEASSTGGRFPVTGLAGEVDVHVSTISPAQQSYSEAQDHHPGGRGDTNSPLVAVITMVSTLPTYVCDYPRFFPYRYHNSYRPAVITGIYLKRQIVPSARMEALMQHYQAAGFTKEVSKHAPERPSTNRMYNDRWLCFANWDTGKGFDPLGPTAAQLATFLYELFDTHGLSPLTIKAYRSCLASVLSRTGKAAAVQTETISDMISLWNCRGLD